MLYLHENKYNFLYQFATHDKTCTGRRKFRLLTHPPPKVMFCFKWEVSVNVGLGEG